MRKKRSRQQQPQHHVNQGHANQPNHQSNRETPGIPTAHVSGSIGGTEHGAGRGGGNASRRYAALKDPNIYLAVATLALVFIGVGALWISRDVEQRQLRAYVGTTFGEESGKSSFYPPGLAIIRLPIHNFGQTPAYEVRYEAGIDLRAYPLPKNNDFKVPSIENNTAPNPFTLFPNMTTPMGIVVHTKRPLTQSEVASIQDGKTHQMYVWGTISYRDAFGTQRWTHFCVGFYNLTGEGADFAPCSAYNDSN